MAKKNAPKGTEEIPEQFDHLVNAFYDESVDDQAVEKFRLLLEANKAIDRVEQKARDRNRKKNEVDSKLEDYLQTYDRQRQVYNKNLKLGKPTSAKMLLALLKKVKADKEQIRPAGSSHSYSDISVGNDIFINTHSLNKVGWPLRQGTGKAAFAGQLRQEEIKSSWQFNTMRSKWKDMSKVKIKGGIITNDSSLKDILAVRRVAEGNTQLMEMQSGIKLEDLNAKLQKRDLGLPNMGGYDGQTIMGVVSTSTHGAGVNLGPFPDIVKSFVLATTGKLVNGRIVSGKQNDDVNFYRIEPTNGITNATNYKKNQSKYRVDGRDIVLVQDDNVFKSVQVSFGSMGIVYSMIIQVIQKYYMTETCRVTTLDKALAELKPNPKNKDSVPDVMIRYRNYSWMVCPYAIEKNKKGEFKLRNPVMKLPQGGLTPAQHKNIRVVVMMRNITPAPKGFKPTPRTHDGDKLKMKALGAIVGRIKKSPGISPFVVMTALDTMKSKVNKLDIYNMIYISGMPGEAGYATEMGFPIQTMSKTPTFTNKPLRSAIKNVTDVAHKDFFRGTGDKRRVLTGPYAVRFVKSSPAYMSMMYERYTVMIELDMISGSPHGPEVLNGHQDSMMKLPNTRPHWGLEFSHWKTNPTALGKMYPKFPEWYEVYQQLNSAGTFENRTTKRLGLKLKPVKAAPKTPAKPKAKPKAKPVAKAAPKKQTAAQKQAELKKIAAQAAAAAKSKSKPKKKAKKGLFGRKKRK